MDVSEQTVQCYVLQVCVCMCVCVCEAQCVLLLLMRGELWEAAAVISRHFPVSSPEHNSVKNMWSGETVVFKKKKKEREK